MVLRTADKQADAEICGCTAQAAALPHSVPRSKAGHPPPRRRPPRAAICRTARPRGAPAAVTQAVRCATAAPFRTEPVPSTFTR